MRGSRKHVLDWISQREFSDELVELVRPVNIEINSTSVWRPLGHSDAKEARLESFGPVVYPDLDIWPKLESWWLQHTAGANTPNWDIALSCTIEGQPSLVLVEAKAHVSELSSAGKSLKPDVSSRSRENHERIDAAIKEASEALGGSRRGVRLSRDHSYQLANRMAFSWRLASWGMPVVLVYLGFTGDQNMADVGEPIRDDAHWQKVFGDHLEEIAPREWINSRVETTAAPFWLLARSRPMPSVHSAAT